MNTTITKIFMVCLLFILYGCSTASNKIMASENTLNPKIVLAESDVKADKNGKVDIKGIGFKPMMEVNILIQTADGVTTDINWALEPKPVANQKGEWTTTWTFGRFIQKKLIMPGEYSIVATDMNYKQLAQTAIRFNSQ